MKSEEAEHLFKLLIYWEVRASELGGIAKLQQDEFSIALADTAQSTVEMLLEKLRETQNDSRT